MALERYSSSSDDSESYSNTGWEEAANGSNPYSSDSFEDSVDEQAAPTASATTVPEVEEVPLQTPRSREDGACSKATSSGDSSALRQHASVDSSNDKPSGKEYPLPTGKFAVQHDTGFRPGEPVFGPDQDRAEGDEALNGVGNNGQQAWEMSPPERLSPGHLLAGETKHAAGNNSDHHHDHHDHELPCVGSPFLIEKQDSSGGMPLPVRSSQVSPPPGNTSFSEAVQYEDDARNDLAVSIQEKHHAAWNIPPAKPCPPCESPATTTTTPPEYRPDNNPARSPLRARSGDADCVTAGCLTHSSDAGSSSSSSSSSSISSDSSRSRQQQQKLWAENARAEYSGKPLFDRRCLNKIRRARRHSSSSSSSSTNSMPPKNAHSRDASGALDTPDQGKGEDVEAIEDVEDRKAKQAQQQPSPFASAAQQQYRWRDAKNEVFSTEGCVKSTTERVRRQSRNDENRSPASMKSNCRVFNRAWSPSQWNAVQPRRTTPVQIYRSQKSISRSVIGRIQAFTALEAMKSLPATCSADGVQEGSGGLQYRREGRHSRPGKRPHREQTLGISTYASIKAEELRTRRDSGAWLARVAAGRDEPVQDPLSLMGECLEQHRQELRRARDAPPPSSSPDASSSWLASSDPNSTGSMDDGDSAAVYRTAAERRFILSAPWLEDLVTASRDLLSEEEEHSIASDHEEVVEQRARIAGHVVGTCHSEDGGRQYETRTMGDETRRRGDDEEAGCVESSRLRPATATATSTAAAMAVAVAAGELKYVSTNREECRAGPKRTAAAAAQVGDGGRGRRVCSSYLFLRNDTPRGRGGDSGQETVEDFARRCLAESQLLK